MTSIPSGSSPFRVRQENDEWVYELVVDGQVVCTARTCANRIVKIITVSGQRRTGYGTRLFRHVEEEARKNGATLIDTTDIDPDDNAAVSFFEKNGYALRPIPGDEEFLEGTKNLGKSLS